MPQLPQYDPLAVPAERNEITTYRDDLESAPVTVGEMLVDIDEKAEKRMQEAIDLWDTLTEGATTIEWTLGNDATVKLTQAALINLLVSARQVRALRGFQLHRDARSFKENPATTKRDLLMWKADILATY